jgi:streptogramin lyase
LSGAVDIIPISSGDGTAIDGLALGPDGNVWFAEFNHIGKITPAGKITEYAYPTPYGVNQYGGVAAGADGNVWFAESSGNAIGRVVPSTGQITMFPISPARCTPAPLVLGNDRNLWSRRKRVGRYRRRRHRRVDPRSADGCAECALVPGNRSDGDTHRERNRENPSRFPTARATPSP